ncbi:hypothetical protein C0995_006314 [Termitomyces sp. Mi166|nr:hypothetical protein C0995_006314 [Termitomyces sp. Mi166\
MSFATGADNWSPPTSLVNTCMTAPLPSTAGQASGTPPIPGEGPSATLVGTAKYWAHVSQMELMITSIMACLTVIEDGLQIASVTTQKAPQPSKVLASASKAPPSSSKTPTAPTSHIPRHVARTTSKTPLPIPLAQELPPTDGQARCYKCALEIPDSLVLHVIGHQGRGLKQAHDLSGSWLAAFAVGPAGNEGRQFVTIRGTNQQIGEALVVIGKRIAKQRVRAPWKQKTGNSAPNVAALAPSPSDLDSASSTPRHSTQLTRPPCSTLSHSAATPATWATPSSLLAGSPMVTGPLTSAKPSASGSPMDTTSPMALSTLTPGMSETPVISYGFGHYSGANTAMRGSNTAQRSRPFRGCH